MCTDAMLYEESNVNVPQQNNEILILSEPVDTIAPIGSYASLSASIVANSPILQWFDKYGNQVPHANQNSLTFQSVRRQDYGFYRLEVTERFTPPRKLTRWVELKAPPQLYRDAPTPVSRPILQRTPMGGMFHQGERIELKAPPQLYRDAPTPVSRPILQRAPMGGMFHQGERIELKAPPQLYRDAPTPVSRPILQRTPMGGMFHQGERVELVGQFQNATYYQWYLNGTALYGCTSSSLLIPNANLQDSGEFLLQAVNGAGSTYVSVRVQIC